ncbi:MAG: hypothetical protein IPO88_14470 [Nannocystis sp.]|uniref:hypothetical protein n=1 Tax=Nannocystis sp. TaxID=1962667 RepID=UPI002429E72E|nr:hypothetical protein [Nannocystis sp.]MBK9754677.1 hypothetical protein [Nannocystis sp.]
MSLVSRPCVTDVRPLRTLAFAAIVLATGCGDSGTGTDSNATDAATTMDASAGTDAASTGDAQTTDAPTTDAPTTGPGVVSYTADVQPLWDARCVIGCHEPGGGGFLTSGLDLSPAVSYAQLVGVMSVGAPALSRVAASDSMGSYLWHKLNNTQVDVGGSGSQMPVGGLPPGDLATIKSWIDGGALP